ncbi:nitroreductase [Kangiella sp. HZ709]|uniref:nitroreductase family protein n=1 Tax=Kangiella sp. HZ709 TaxID=2666328 RepID=UPI0012B06915|nr:nitroreductase [Kangiella sp. HZ709]MRX26657.1 nitroreductase [Kangiella sp. HZ709]
MLENIINRVSCGRLTAPEPSAEQLELLFQAALRAPDHKGIKPWQYIVFSGEEQLNQLADLYLQASLLVEPDLEESKRVRILSLPHRAPMVIVAVAKSRNHEKVPHIEEVLSAGAGVQNLLLGAYDLGYGAYWRSGPLCFNPHLKTLLGLEQEDTMVGFIYLGTPSIALKAKPVPEVKDFVRFGLD